MRKQPFNPNFAQEGFIAEIAKDCAGCAFICALDSVCDRNPCTPIERPDGRLSTKY